MKFALTVSVSLLLQASTITPPKTWDEEGLREWATPIAALNVRPGHFSEEEYSGRRSTICAHIPFITRVESRLATST